MSQPDKLNSEEWKPKHDWLRCGAGEIVRSTLMDGHVYLQAKNGDIYRVWIGFDGIPLIECTEYNAALPKDQEHKPIDDHITAIEVYDDEIRYGGKTIWRGEPRYKTPGEVDAIVKEWQNSTKTTDRNELPTGFEYGNHLTD